MQPNPILKPLALLLALSGLLQGLAWLIAGILGLLTYSEVLEIPDLPQNKAPTHNDYIAMAFKLLYFDKAAKTETTSLHVDGKTFTIFMILYTIFSFFWVLISGVAFYMSRLSKWQALRNSLIIYCLLVTMITCVDFTFMGMLVEDYRKLWDVDNKLGLVKSYALTVVGIMFTLAARGYVLLLLNVASIIYCLFYCYAYPTFGTSNARQVLYNIPIDAYKEYPGDLNFAEAVNQEPAGLGWARAFANDAFNGEQWDNTETILQSNLAAEAAQKALSAGFKYATKPTPKQPAAPLWLGGPRTPQPDYPTEDPIRKVQKSSPYALPAPSGRPPPPPVVPPVPPPKPAGKFQKPQGKKGPPIPFPDYSPPASPKDLRPVIKPHSSYY